MTAPLFEFLQAPPVPKQTEVLTARYQLLQRLIRQYDSLYYAGDTTAPVDGSEDLSLPDDEQYDALKAEVRSLETLHPELFGRYGTVSVTAIIGQVHPPATPPDIGLVPHLTPMLSLDNIYNEAELEAFLQRLKAALHWREGDRELTFNGEHKYDGMSMSLRYDRGTLVQASTRGNGEIGEDSTAQMLRFGVPQALPAAEIADFPAVFEIRGEVLLPRANFDRINADFAAHGQPLLKNPRNAAGGILRRGRQHLEFLTFTAYGGESQEPFPVNSHADLMARIARMGFRVPDAVTLQFPEDITELHRQLESTRDTLPYEIDGLVVKLDDLHARTEAGMTNTAPRWAIAFKFQEPQVTTELEDIAVDVGKSGELAPRAVLKTVRLAGSDISSATLHNATYISSMDIRPGDHVLIEKAGGVIPRVVRRDDRYPRRSHEPFRFPDRCPACQAPVAETLSTGGPEYHCTNDTCPRRIYKRLEFFCTKDCMNIKGLGESILTALFNSGRVRDAADLYTLSVHDLTGTYTTDEGGTRRATGLKTAMRLLGEIQDSKTRELRCLINGLALRHTGEGTSQRVASAAGTLQRLMEFTPEDLKAIRDVGEKTATSMWQELHSPRLLDMIDRLVRAGVSPAPARDTVIGAQLSGLRFVVTGTLSVNRAAAEAHLRRLGAEVSGSVTKKTSYLVVGTDGGGKIEKARTLGIPMLSEVDLAAMLVERGAEPL